MYTYYLLYYDYIEQKKALKLLLYYVIFWFGNSIFYIDSNLFVIIFYY